MAEQMFIKGAESATRFEVKRYGYTLTFEISPDALECNCCYEPSNIGGTPITELELQEHLAKFDLKAWIDQEAVAALLVSAASAESVSDLLLAKGIPMTRGEDGKVVLAVADDLAKKPDEVGDGTVNFHNVQTFLNVEPGDLVATIIPPGGGTPGRTVTGKIIPAEPGVPVKIEIGQNIRLSDDGLNIFATETGRVCLLDKAISVENIYEVKGDVGFKIGNISFKGFVEIRGDVLDGFFVKATKGIKIHGNIGVCTVESDGNISFCGMSGQGTGSIRCGGSITANFIYDSLIECAGDVIAEVEIRGSQIRSLGMISVNKGGLSGGDYFSLAGIESSTLGSKTSLLTRVVAGVHYKDLEELGNLFNELKLLVAEHNAAPHGAADPKEFARKRSLIATRTQEVRSRVYEQYNPKINIKKMLYEGVNLTIGSVNDNTLGERKGPISIIENSIEGGLRFLGMTSLAYKAQMIEQTFIKQHQIDQQKNWSTMKEETA